MSTEPFIGEVKIFGFNFAPRGYMTCQGQILSIAQNTALFSLLGTTYGGNGQTTFALPNLQGRFPIGQGQGPGLPSYSMGEVAGAPTVSLQLANLPAHTHAVTNNIVVKLPVNGDGASSKTPVGKYPAITGAGNIYATVPTIASGNRAYAGDLETTGTVLLNNAGGNVPFDIMNPFIAMNYSIAVEGIFPSRN